VRGLPSNRAPDPSILVDVLVSADSDHGWRSWWQPGCSRWCWLTRMAFAMTSVAAGTGLVVAVSNPGYGTHMTRAPVSRSSALAYNRYRMVPAVDRERLPDPDQLRSPR